MSIVVNTWLLTCLTCAMMATGHDLGVISGADCIGAVAGGEPIARMSHPTAGHDDPVPELPIVAPQTGAQSSARSVRSNPGSMACVCLPGNCRLRASIANVIPLLPIGRQLSRPHDLTGPDAGTCTDGSCRLR